MLAFRPLPAEVRKHVMPIFDVAAPTKSADQAAAQKYVARNIARTEKVAAGFSAVFVDSSELDPAFRLPGALHPLTAASAAIAKAGAQPIPVTGLHRDTAHNDAASAARKVNAKEEICLRLDATDVSTATLTYKGILGLLTEEDIETAQTYLLLDLQCLHGQEWKPVVNLVGRLLTLLEEKPWAGIIVGGYGMPDQLSAAISPNDQGYLPRVEQRVFYELAQNKSKTALWFADYTVLSPAVVELDWRLIRKVMAPRALYTLDDSWFVVRGGAFSNHKDGYDQYYTIADEIVALDEYCGEHYSAGDKYIWDCSERVDTPGSPASWITACVNHHITFTAKAHAAASL